MNSATKLVLLLAVASTASCSDAVGPRAVTPGTLLLTLTTPYDDDAALLLQLTGPAISPAAVEPATSAQHVYTSSATAGAVTVAVFGSLRAGPLLRVHVPESSVAAYGVAVLEVADANNLLRPDLAGYSVRFVKD